VSSGPAERPTLSPAEVDGRTLWAVYDVSVMVPDRFRLAEHRLHLGDFVFRFVGPGRSQLAIRQVFPASLAVGRRPMRRWMRAWPFREHRRYRARGEVQEARLAEAGRELVGLRGEGSKRLRFPFGRCRPLQTRSLVVRDASLDRLLVVEHDAPAGVDGDLAEQVVLAMNRHRCAPETDQ
jgi:hypothetical protein